MKRNLKALGLALLAIGAMSAIAAQGAQAKFDTLRTFPAGSNAFLRVEADPTEPAQTLAFKTGGFSTTCKQVSTTGSTISDKATEVTGEPFYSSCVNSLGGGATVRPNGCHYLFTSETDANEHAVVHIVCPAGKAITIESAGATISIPEQTLNGIHYSNIQTGTNEREMHLTASWTIEDQIHYTCAPTFNCNLAGIGTSGTEASTNGKWTVSGREDNSGVEGANQVGITYETLSTSTMP